MTFKYITKYKIFELIWFQNPIILKNILYIYKKDRTIEILHLISFLKYFNKKDFKSKLFL